MGAFSWLAGRWRAAFETPRIRVGGSVLQHDPVAEQLSRIGGGVTPARVTSILRQADSGNIRQRVDLANEARQKDGHLHSCLRTREIALTAVPLTFPPHETADGVSEADSEIAAFVTETIAAAVGNGQEWRSIDDLISHLSGGIYHGFAVAETSWRKEGKLIVPDGWALKKQRRFAFRRSDGRLVWSDYNGSTQGTDLMAEHPGQFVQHMPREMGGDPRREGLSTLLVWAALFRNWATADWLKLAELAWKPWRLGKLDDKADEEDEQGLINVLQSLTTDGVGILNQRQELQLEWPEGGRGESSSHEALCKFMGAEMSKAIIGQTLTTEAGERGARSLGEVHDRVRRDLRDYDAKGVSATLRRDIVAPLVWMNFGNVPVPGVRFETEDSEDGLSSAERLKALQEAGMEVPKAYAHDVTGVPQPKPGEALLGDSEDDVDEEEADDSDPFGTEDDETEKDDDGDELQE